MQKNPGAGSSLERMVHLFASGAEQPKAQTAPALPVRKVRAFYLLSAGGGIVRTFYSCNLGICLAESGLNSALLDLETRLPTAVYSFGPLGEEITIADIIHPHTPAWDELYEVCDEHHIIIDGRHDIKVLSLTPSGATKLSSWIKEGRHANPFRGLFHDLDITLINLPETMIESGLLRWLPVSRFLITARPDLDEIMPAYELIKRICDQMPSAEFGLLVHRADDAPAVRSAFTSLSKSVRRGLGKDVRFMGQFPSDRRIAESVLTRSPLALDRECAELRRRLDSIAGYVVKWISSRREVSGSAESMAS